DTVLRLGDTGMFSCIFNVLHGWGTWIRTKIDGVRVRCSTVELSPNGRFKRGFARWRGVVNSEARRAAQAHAASGCERLRPGSGHLAAQSSGRPPAPHTCSTATTPGAALSAPAIAAVTA